uniref:TubC N-terminal docking domain-containing protein n=1 Tax=Acidithiobacillus sulfuriphilus TaxID=1867749 RepID=A0A3M8QZF3_9PROT|nr:hypothetical protein EC580_08150 [Acidithiobacillus sulfuriphilus]
MMPAQVIVEIAEEGGEIRLEDGRLKVKGIPARLIPLIREHKIALLALLREEEAGQRSTSTACVAPEPDMAPQSLPATVTCGSCAEFEPGKTPLGIGRCSRTANGLPPVASRGYGACFPIAPRFCPDHKELT